MDVALPIIGFVVALFVLIACHELGHMFVSKKAGVPIEEFGIGLPPRLVGIKRGETIYSINAIPLGAFVRTPGESDPSVSNSLASKGPWTRVAVYAAGPLVNILLAFVLLSIFFMFPTEFVTGDGVMVHSVSEDSPAAAHGIQPGDVILRIDDREIHEWDDMREEVDSNGGEERTFIIERDGQPLEIQMAPRFNADVGRYTIGVILCWGIVTNVDPGTPAREADIRPGDTIASIDRKVIYGNESMLDALDSAEGKTEISIALLRDEKVQTNTLKPGSQGKFELTGLSAKWVSDTRLESQRLPVWKAVYEGGDFLIHIPILIKESIPILREDPSLAAVGVVGAGQMTVEAVEAMGFSRLILLAGMISVGLALFNFFPIPPLDGGGILIGVIEGVRGGKRLSPRTIRFAYMAGTALIIAVFVGIMYSDIARLIGGRLLVMNRRRDSKPLRIGDVSVGGDAPVVVQSMAKTDTRDITATINQIRELEECGCDIIRVAVPDEEAAQALSAIKRDIRIPLIADIHFDYRLALTSLGAGVDGLRLNPGNISDPEHIAAVVRAAKPRQVPVRIGVNAGSLPKSITSQSSVAERMVQAAMQQIRLLEDLDFDLIKISLKAFDVPTTVEAYQLMAEKTSYPLHLGITEAGLPRTGLIRSALGIGILLYQGIGDTIRVSLTADPKEEVIAAYEILKGLSLRQRGSTLVSCPTCGRCEVDLFGLARDIEGRLARTGKIIKVAVMGCVVNGPGEARDADVGIACGQGRGAIFRKGEVVRTVDEADFLEALMREVEEF